METLKLHWLGHPLVELKGRLVKPETRKAAALLAYLSLTPGECSREVLAAMFWQDGNQQKALANLRRTLSSLNSSLPGWIEADRDTIMLKRNGRLWVDVNTFQNSLSQLQKHSHTEKEICDECLLVLGNTVEIYHGEFLEGLNLTDAPIFDEWQFFQRDDLRQKFADALKRLSSRYAERGQWEQAIIYARRWVALDRLDEPASRALMDLYAQSGQRTAALHQYEELTRLLHEQMGQEPEQETRRLCERIRGRDESKETTGGFSPFPLLKTKLHIPTAPAPRVIRSGLVDRLREVEKHVLTIISAPAGFGKTTLLAEWITRTSLPVAWLSLDSRDNDPYRFLSYLNAALESIQEGVGIEACQILRSPQPPPQHIILASLINDLVKIPQPYVMVLDDYQFITEHAVHETVAYLLDHVPSNMHIVISTRADPPLHLGRLRAHGQMLELRTQDLRFTAPEAAEFLNTVMKLGLAPQDIESLEERTEGWVVGLKMAALSIQGREDASQFIRAFSGSHRYVLDYLVEEVLKRQPAHIQSFLLETSVLEKLNGRLCDVLMSDEWRQSGASGQAILEYLEKSNLFVVPLDDHKQWYRYHHLFADLLRNQMQKSIRSQGVARLHLRAAEWYEQNGPILDAIHHASMASDDEMVERLIERHYMEMVNLGEMSKVRFWMGQLSKELIYRRPWLCLYEALSRSWFGQLEDANLLLNEAEKLIRSEVSAPGAQSMLGYHAYVKSRVTAMQGDTHRAIGFCLTARNNIPADNLGLQNDVSITLGYEYFLYGDFINAVRTLHETIRSGHTARAINNPVAAYALLARLHVYQGQLYDAYDLLQKAAQLIQEAGGQYLGATGLVEVEIAALLFECNDAEAALVRLKRGMEYLPWWGKADDFCLAYITLARIQLARGNRAEAAGAIEKAVQLVASCGVFTEARGAVEAAQVKLWLVQGDWPAVEHWAAALDKRFGSHELLRYEDEVTHIMQARVFITQNKPDEAIRLLSCLEESAQSGGRSGRLIEIMILQALAMQMRGDSTQALTALTKSLVLAEAGGYVRIFLDEGESMLKLLKRMGTSKLQPALKDYVKRLLEASVPA